jgi:CxxC motif-containing protein (DUF1111 family)
MPVKDEEIKQLIEANLKYDDGRKKVTTKICTLYKHVSTCRIRRVYEQQGYSLYKRLKKRKISRKANPINIPMQHTGTNVVFPEVSNQTIFPYTDLLLHDMGAGLADNRPDYQAAGQEWRTAPFWGIGLTQAVNGHQYFLHDGRARSLEEAILWHGGEADFSQNYFRAMSAEDRAALLVFLASL